MTHHVDVFLQTRKHFRGLAKVKLQHLNYGEGSKYLRRELDPSNVARLVQIYKEQQCQRLLPGNYIRVLASRETLESAFTLSKLDQRYLIEASTQSTQPPFLDVPAEARLEVLTGHHRLLAAGEYLLDRWWIAELYEEDGLSHATLLALGEGDLNARGISSGEKFRNLRLCQKRGDREAARAWSARLTKNELYTFNTIFVRIESLGDAFDELLPIPGLWPGLLTGSLHEFVYMRCPEELICCMTRIKDTWKSFLPDTTLQSQATATTIQNLEGLFPKFSRDDRSCIKRMMDEYEIFPGLEDPEERATLLCRLQRTPVRIPSFFTFGLDCWYLRSCSVLLRELLPPGYKGSVRQSFFRSRRAAPRCKLQSSDMTLIEVDYGSNEAAAAAAYCQLYLLAMRDGVAPRKGKLGSETRPSRAVAGRCQSLPGQIVSSLGFDANNAEVVGSGPSNASPLPHPIAEPEFSTDSRGLTKRQRCGILDIESLESVRPYLFLDVIVRDVDRPPRRNATALAVQRDIFMGFFGDLVSLFSTSQEGHRADVDLHEQPSQSPVQASQALRRASGSPSRSPSIYTDQRDTPSPSSWIDCYTSRDSQLAPGFEVDASLSMEEFHPLISVSKASDAIAMFLESEEKPFVLFDYNSREYAKYPSYRLEALQDNLESLAGREHLFIVLHENGRLKALAYNAVLKAQATQTTRLILVGRRGQTILSERGAHTHKRLLSWIDQLQITAV
ncbi:hypothetical protein TMEN_1898 [Trichophyton mentagrophytes]|nr:hypothetical protein TMEN_1898 [Trichophyton mentagrophytes]